MDQTSNEKSLSKELEIKQLKDELHVLKFAFSMPRIHMVDYFADLINKVDIACEVFLNSHSGEINEASRRARIDQSEIVDVIKKHERDCLENMPENEFEEGLNGQVMEKIGEIGVRLNGEICARSFLKIGSEIQETLLLLERRIFMDKDLWFLTKEDSFLKEMKKFRRQEKKSSEIWFGVLVFIKDELFLSEDLLEI